MTNMTKGFLFGFLSALLLIAFFLIGWHYGFESGSTAAIFEFLAELQQNIFDLIEEVRRENIK